MIFPKAKEYPAVVSLALVMAVRMLGLFMIFPVFSMHAQEFTGASASLIGLALGIYGLTQALLQIPFGTLSDRVGRKPVMTIGLALFVLGSIIAALSGSIYGLILGRALQGAGAIGSTVLAMVADLTRDEHRSQAMGVMGLAVGSAFALAMVIAPLLNTWMGLAGIFWATAALGLIAEIMVWWLVPAPPKSTHPQPGHLPVNLSHVLSHPELLRLDASILLLHAILTAFFIAVPVVLVRVIHLTPVSQTWLYLWVLILAFALMLPGMIFAEKRRQVKRVFLAAIGLLLLAQLLLWPFHHSQIMVSGLLLLFFTAFSLLEALLPSWVSKIAPLAHKGTAMGCYSTAQFLGIFIGGSCGGWIYAHWGVEGIFGFGAGLALLWMMLAVSLRQPPYHSTLSFNLQQFSEQNHDILTQRLYGIAGIAEVAIMPAEALIYLKIDRSVIDKLQLRQSLENSKLIVMPSSQGG